MKTYPYTTPDGIIELVRKDEHDAVVQELEQTRREFDELKRWHETASNTSLRMVAERDQLRAELTRWQSLAERLATALDNLSHDCHNHAKDIIQIRWGYDGDCGSKLSAEQIEECCDAAKPALAAYESAKSGNLPDPLAEAVKRMEEVPESEMVKAYCEGPGTCGVFGGCDRVRARLISAAKGEQP